MTRNNSLSYILCAFMLLTALTTKLVTPAKVAVVNTDNISLKGMIPEQIGEWKIDPSIVPLEVSPEVTKGLHELYSQTLVRTYVNNAGEHVMLSVAYGGDQSGSLSLHKPEFCYGSQGFEISDLERDNFSYAAHTFPVTRLMAVRGRRSEPITYWTTVGDKVVRNGVDQKLQKLRYAMTGKIPDGILIRLSTIEEDKQHSYQLQNSFIQSMLSSMKPEDRTRITGSR